MMMLRLKKTLACLLALILLSGCGGPQDVPPNGGGGGGGTNAPHNECSPGFGGTDSNHDGITDACAGKLGIPSNASTDCNGDGIVNGLDNPTTCSGKDPNVCDEYCQANRDRILKEIEDSLNIGRAALGDDMGSLSGSIDRGVVAFRYPSTGLNIAEALQRAGVTNSTIKEKCLADPQINFYIYFSGSINYPAVANGSQDITPARTVNGIFYEMCGVAESYTAADSHLNPMSANFIAKFYGANAGPVKASALFDPAVRSTTSIKAELSGAKPSEASCPTTEGLFTTLTLTLTGEIQDPTGGAAQVKTLITHWTRPSQTTCDLVNNSRFGASGTWVNVR